MKITYAHSNIGGKKAYLVKDGKEIYLGIVYSEGEAKEKAKKYEIK